MWKRFLEAVAAAGTFKSSHGKGNSKSRDLICGSDHGGFVHVGMGAGAQQNPRGGQGETGEAEDK